MIKPHYFGGGPVLIAALLLCAIASASLRAYEKRQPSPVAQKLHLKVADTARLEVKAYWEPIKESMDNFHIKWDELRDFRPAKAAATYRGSDFRPLLPTVSVYVGDIWKLDQGGLLTLLRQLHPGATLQLSLNNGDSLGAYASLRAFNERFADILLRIHAEFILKEGYFTPGQFAGRLVIDRSNGRIAFFRLYLPPGAINFDVRRRITATAEVNGKEVERKFIATDSGFAPRNLAEKSIDFKDSIATLSNTSGG